MERRGPLVSEADVAAFEQQFGFPLPDDYRDFLLQVNGGRPDDSHCEFSKGVVNRLFSLNDQEDESRDLLTRALRARRDLPSPSLLFVGHDDGGGRLVIPLEGSQRGEVWLHLTDDVRPEDANPRTIWSNRRDFMKLADSFTAFMHSLTPLS